MKIFVSGQINDISAVREAQQEFIAAGHEITHDWTRNEAGDRMLGSREEKLGNKCEAAIRAVKDINGVVDCDVYVICTNNRDSGKGMFVELGAALALQARFGMPKIFLIGGMNHISIFYLHPSVSHVSSVSEILAKI